MRNDGQHRRAALLVAAACRSDGAHEEAGAPPDNRLFDDDHVLVVPDAEGLHLVRPDGSLAFSAEWAELVDGCTETCGGEGSSADGDGLLVSFLVGDGTGPSDGGVARLDAAGAMDWRVDGFVFPHDAIRDPADDTVIVPESSEGRVTWFAGDGSSSERVRRMNERTPGFEGGQPNGADRFDWHGSSLLVLSNRATGPGWTGAINLWDVTVAGAPELVWRFPSEGGLATPHSPILRPWGGRWWLLWAHTDGARPEGSSIGLAVSDDPTAPPEYVGDLLPPADADPWGYARGIELSADGRLFVTDSGSGFGTQVSLPPRIEEAPMPDLTPSGASGAAGDQVFVRLAWTELLVDGLSNPFEGWLWRWTGRGG